jgi:hypothetical protein
LGCALAALVGCFTPSVDVDSEAEAYEAAEICARGGAGAIASCTGAIRSGHLDDENQARAYLNRGVAYDHEERYGDAVASYTGAIQLKPGYAKAYGNRAGAYWAEDDLEAARDDYRIAYELTGEPEYQQYYERLVAEIEGEQPAEPGYALWFNGFACERIGEDPDSTAANEIFLTVIVQQADGSAKTEVLPGGGSPYYPNVRGGYVRRGSLRIWRGDDQLLTLRASLWEHDEGGPSVQVVANAIVTSVTGRTRRGQDLDLGHVPRSVLESQHDFLGAGGFREFSPADLAREGPKRERDIEYHLRIHHTQDADCTSYYLAAQD